MLFAVLCCVAVSPTKHTTQEPRELQIDAMRSGMTLQTVASIVDQRFVRHNLAVLVTLCLVCPQTAYILRRNDGLLH